LEAWAREKKTLFLPLTEEMPNRLLGDYLELRQKRRNLGEAALLVCGVALLCWCGYLTLTINKGVPGTSSESTRTELDFLERRIDELQDMQTSATPLSVDLNIEEHGTRYKQTVEYDPVTQALTYKVPHHNDVLSSINIIHADSDTMVTRVDGKNGEECLIRSAPAGFKPKANALGAFEASTNNETLTPEQAKVTSYIDFRMGKLSQSQRGALLESMQMLCEGLDIVRINQIQVSDEEFDDISHPIVVNATLGQDHHRFKRSFERTFSVCDTSSACSRGVPGGRRCLWEVIPHRTNNEMLLSHLRSQEWDCVTCCQKRQSNGMCACSEITSDASFVRCQRNLFG